MTISAKVISDSIAECSPRLTTLQIIFPRFILAEFNTHRVFSRNFRSSRAVPVKKLIEEVRNNPYEPLVWLKNKPGMQGGEPMSPDEIERARNTWRQGARYAADVAEWLATYDLHKQWANRGLEPYLYVHGVVTSTEWSNFFALRRHKDAQPEMKALADAIHEAMENSESELLKPGQWHMPFITDHDLIHLDSGLLHDDLIKISVARCARTSYMTHEGKEPNIDDDLKLYDRLVGQIPLHASPCEHQATPDTPTINKNEWAKPHLHGNLKGWCQHRKFLLGENQ